MKLTIERSVLLKSLGHVQSVVEKKNTMPILSNVKFEAENGVLALTATDLDLEIVEKVAADVEKPGSATVPAQTIFDIVRKLADGAQVELVYDAKSHQMSLRSGRSRFSLSGLNADDFPSMMVGSFPHTFTIPGTDLCTLIDRTKFAISTEETRYYLNGVFMHDTVSEGQPVLRSVATDGHRLARSQVPLPEGAKGLPGVIIPRKPVLELRKLIEEAGSAITVSLSESKVQFSFDAIVMTSKLVDGTFPDYERVIPSGNDKILDIDKKSLATAVDRVAAITTDKGRGIKVSVSTNLVTLLATSAEAGSAQEEVEGRYQSSEMEIGFNSRYLLEILSQISGEEVRISLADSASPAVLQESEDDSAVYVLMPMRV